MGFLDRQSLTMIVDAPTDRDQLISTPHRIVTHNCTIQSNLSFSGRHHINFVIAAKFNRSTSSGWPVLQIKRRVPNDSFNTIVMTQLEPRPTGYLNVFEYKLLSDDVQQGDVVHIVPQSYGQQRYLLGYQTTPFHDQPQVCVTWSNDWTRFTRTRSTIIHTCKHTTYTSEAFTNTSSESLNTTPKSSIIDKTSESPTTISAKGRPVIVITGGVLGTLVIIILSVVLIIITFLICQHKKNAKRFSLNTNTGVSANVSSDALETVSIPDNMIQAGNQMIPKPCGEGDGANIRVGTGNNLKLSHQNNPQEVSLLAVQWNQDIPEMGVLL